MYREGARDEGEYLHRTYSQSVDVVVAAGAIRDHLGDDDDDGGDDEDEEHNRIH